MSRRLRVEADGGSRGNPGVAGYGALVRDGVTGAVLVERAAPLGQVSNNVAEYSGLIAGLDAAFAIDPGAKVTVAMDSKLVIEQMSGRWKVKHEDMRRLALEAREIVDRIRAAGGSVAYTWVPRAENTDADLLSNKGMDGRTIDRRLDRPEAAAVADARDDGPTRVVLVRHGVTDFTVAGRLDGRGGPDPDLNATGRAQAEAAARGVLHLVGPGGARVVTSSLARARQTGAAVAAAIGVEPVVDDAWDEQSFGDWDGAVMRDLIARDPESFLAMRKDPGYKRPGGESHSQLTERVVAAWEAVLAEGGTTVVVCHRKPIMVVLRHVLGLTVDASWRLAAAPGSLTAVEVLPHGELSVVFTNRT